MMDPSKPLVIFDTDMDTDCDDAGALMMLLRAAKAKEIELLGIVADAPVKEAAPCCEAFCRYVGAEIPIGAVYEQEYLHTARFSSYAEHLKDQRPAFITANWLGA